MPESVVLSYGVTKNYVLFITLLSAVWMVNYPPPSTLTFKRLSVFKYTLTHVVGVI